MNSWSNYSSSAATLDRLSEFLNRIWSSRLIFYFKCLAIDLFTSSSPLAQSHSLLSSYSRCSPSVNSSRCVRNLCLLFEFARAERKCDELNFYLKFLYFFVAITGENEILCSWQTLHRASNEEYSLVTHHVSMDGDESQHQSM